MKLSPLPSPSLRYDRVGTPEYVACAKPVRRIALKASYTSVYTNYQRLYAFPHVFVFDVTEYEPGAYAAAADDGDGASRDARARGPSRTNLTPSPFSPQACGTRAATTAASAGRTRACRRRPRRSTCSSRASAASTSCSSATRSDGEKNVALFARTFPSR